MTIGKKLVMSLFLYGIIVVTGCTTAGHSPQKEGAMTITISSNAFAANSPIPKRYTCDGENLSPALSWQNVPDGTQSLVLIMDDPDAPIGTFVHWVLYNIPAGTTELSEGVKGIGVEGLNDFGKLGYGGPCPPRGSNHRYFFKIYALDTQLSLGGGAKKSVVEKAMSGHILARGELVGRYGR